MHIHVRIDRLELRRLLVDLEDTLPFSVRQRRQSPHDRAPFRHREARSRESCKAAEDDHREYESATDQEPGRNRPVAGPGLRECVHDAHEIPFTGARNHSSSRADFVESRAILVP